MLCVVASLVDYNADYAIHVGSIVRLKMFRSLALFWHHIFQLHCEHCQKLVLEQKICQSCETLREVITQLRLENSRLLDSLLSKPVEEERKIDVSNLKPIRQATIPWRTRQHMLEVADRDTAEKIKKAREAESINKIPTSTDEKLEDLEDEVLAAGNK